MFKQFRINDCYNNILAQNTEHNFVKIINQLIMKGFATSSNPFTSGTKPRKFLADRVQMLKMEQMLGKKVVRENKQQLPTN